MFVFRQSRTMLAVPPQHAAVGVGQVLGHRHDVDRAVGDVSRDEPERQAAFPGKDRAGDPAEQLDVAQRLAVRAVGQVEVVDLDGLLVDRPVPAEAG